MKAEYNGHPVEYSDKDRGLCSDKCPSNYIGYCTLFDAQLKYKSGYYSWHADYSKCKRCLHCLKLIGSVRVAQQDNAANS